MKNRFLVLLFLLAIGCENYKGVDIKLPQTSNKPKLSVRIYIDAYDNIYIDDLLVKIENVSNVLSEKILIEPRLTVLLKTSNKTTMSIIESLHTELREARALKINYSNTYDFTSPSDESDNQIVEKSNIVTININDNSDILVSYGTHDRFLTIEELRTHCEFLIEHRGVEKDYSGNYSTPLIFSVITHNRTKYEDYIAVLDELKKAHYIHPIYQQ